MQIVIARAARSNDQIVILRIRATESVSVVTFTIHRERCPFSTLPNEWGPYEAFYQLVLTELPIKIVAHNKMRERAEIVLTEESLDILLQ